VRLHTKVVVLAILCLGLLGPSTIAFGWDPFGLNKPTENLQQTVDEVVKEWRTTVKTLQNVTYDAVPGAPWARLLRMSHEGTPEEQAEARKILESYFGLKTENQYRARIWIEYSGTTPLKFDFFGAPTLGDQEAFKYAASYDWNDIAIGPNSASLLTDAAKKEKFVKDYVAIVQTPDGAGCPMVGAGPTVRGPFGAMPSSYFPEPGCVTKGAEAKAAKMRDVISEFITTDIKPTGKSDWDFPWDPTQPFLFVALRKEQFDAFMKDRKEKTDRGITPPKLEITIAVTDPKDSNLTYNNKPKHTFALEEFKGEYDVAGLNYKIVAARFNFTNITFGGPKDIQLQEEIAAMWDKFQKTGK
jgi:hypothetical protein